MLITISIIDPRAWQGVLFGLAAFPTLVTSAILGLVGQRARAAAVVAWIRRRWLDEESSAPSIASSWRRWAALPISLIVLIATLYLLTGIVINFCYPLRPDSQPTDWGGPSLAGRWAVHAAGGVLFAVATPLICDQLRTLARRVL